MANDEQWALARETLIDIGFALDDSDKGKTERLAEAVEEFQRGFAFGWLKPDGDPGDKTTSALEYAAERRGACGPHFAYREFASKGNGRIRLTNELVLGLEHAREKIGGVPIRITSGYRDPRHNSKVGGSPQSQHLSGCAADVELPSIDVVKSWGVFTGIGAAESSGQVVHVDMRPGDPGAPTMWAYAPDGSYGPAPAAWSDLPVTGHGFAAIADWPLDAESNDQVIDLTVSDAVTIGEAGGVERALAYVESKGRADAGTRSHLERILAACRGAEMSRPQTAYVLATALHESRLGQWMEEHASGEAYEGRLDLGNTEQGDGRRYKGRGYVQLTGRANYRTWTQRLRDLGHDIDLIANPDAAAEPGIASVILARGMATGTFTGKRLDWFINSGRTDFVEARRIINGKDRARQIAGYASHFLDALA